MDSLHTYLPASHDAIGGLRDRVRHFLGHAGVPSTVVDDIELVASELASNAIQQQPTHPLEIEVTAVAGEVRLTVRNESTGETLTSPSEWGLSDVLSDHGRGLHIVKALTDRVCVDQADGWTSVSCARRI